MGKYLINIEGVEASLREVQRDFGKINVDLNMRRESLRDEIILNMLDGYEYVNMLLKKDVNILEQSGLVHYLELNHIVLCGTGTRQRKNYLQHIQATTDRFYQQEDFSIKDLRIWAEKHKTDSPWKQAAGAYILQISWPQLFSEGNHRTGALLMSHILVRLGKPPFVLSVENAKGYFDPSSLAKGTNKNLLGMYYKLPKIKKKFAKFLQKQAREELLLRL
ncbi:hypothetical protein [Desulfogranum japonicum]|uniref:hypothetical protein n=1 Tax=Desulfogranum japonicum TaxID=231447 RepID=UPI000401FA17|nr:hypothetical protein [Desulfogranum japonicum]